MIVITMIKFICVVRIDILIEISFLEILVALKASEA